MNPRNTIVEELEQMGSELGRFQPINPYHVPAGYFDSLAEKVMMRIKAEAAVSAKEETAMLSPLLASMKRETPLSVPEGYFENLTSNIPKSSTQTGKTKVISLNAERFFKYAAAAVTVGLISLFAWIMLKPSDGDTEYALNNDTLIDKQVKETMGKLPDVDITTYLNINELTTMEQLPEEVQVNVDDVTLILAEVSDQELQNYVETHGMAKENFN
jgi:hypothetical protein